MIFDDEDKEDMIRLALIVLQMRDTMLLLRRNQVAPDAFMKQEAISQ